MTQLVTARRGYGGDEAVGAVRVRAKAPGPVHEQLAGALAWAALAHRLLAAGSAKEALASAREGLQELEGAPQNVEQADDTLLKLTAAEERIQSGHLADGAAVMLSVLEARIGLHAAAVGAEPAMD